MIHNIKSATATFNTQAYLPQNMCLTHSFQCNTRTCKCSANFEEHGGNNHDSRMSLLEILTAAPPFHTFHEESRPLRIVMCSITAVAMMMAIFKVIHAALPPRTFPRESCHEAKGLRAILKGRYPSSNMEAQRLVWMALPSSECMVSTDRWKEVYLTFLTSWPPLFLFG